MKAKIKRGSGFRGALNYVLSKDEPRVVGGNMSGQTPRELAKEFAAARMLRPDIEKPVWHSSLSAAPGERLTDQQWHDVAARYMKGMGFSESTQYVVVRHTPLQDQLNPPEPKIGKDGQPQKAGPECEHVHIVASRIGLDAKIWYGRKDVDLAIEQTQQIEQEFDLVRTKGFDAPKPVKAPTRGEAGMAARTGEMTPREYCQHTIAAIAATKPTMAEFIEGAQAAGIELRANATKGGLTMNGFSFSHNGIHFKGQDLGAQFKWPTLKKSIDYQPERDAALLLQISAKAAKPAAPEPNKDAEHGRTGPDKPDLERSPAPTTSAGQRPTARGAGVCDQRSDRARALDIPEGALAGLEQRMRNVPLVDMEPMGRRHAAGALRQDVRHNVDLGRARAGDRGLLSTRSGAPDLATLTLPRTGHKSFWPVVFTGPATSFFSRLRKKRPGELTPEQKRQLEQMAERLAHLIMKLVCRLFGIDYQTPDEQQQERRRPRLAKVAPPPRPQPGPAPGPKVAPVPAGPGPASQAQDLKSRSQQVLAALRSRKSEHRTTMPPAAPVVVDPRAAAESGRREAAERRIRLALQSGKGKSAALVDAVRIDDVGSLERLIKDGADPTVNRGAALEAAAHAKRDDLFGRLLRGVPLQDHSDLQQLAQQVGPQAAQKLLELAKTAKAGGSLPAAGIEQYKGPEPGSGAKPGPKGPSGPSGPR